MSTPRFKAVCQPAQLFFFQRLCSQRLEHAQPPTTTNSLSRTYCPIYNTTFLHPSPHAGRILHISQHLCARKQTDISVQHRCTTHSSSATPMTLLHPTLSWKAKARGGISASKRGLGNCDSTQQIFRSFYLLPLSPTFSIAMAPITSRKQTDH